MSGLLSLKLLLHMTTLFVKENNFNNCMQAIHRVQNYNKTEAKHIVAVAKVNHDTQFYGIKGEAKAEFPPPPPPPSPMTFERVDEFLRDRDQDS